MTTIPTWNSETLAEQAKKRLVFVIDRNVYDATDYQADHPGGAGILQSVNGTDATAAFNDVFHSASAVLDLVPLMVAKYVASVPTEGTGTGTGTGTVPPKPLPVGTNVFVILAIILGGLAFIDLLVWLAYRNHRVTKPELSSY